MLWSDNLRIETPEQIDFDLEVAGPGSRFVAQFVDWIFKWLIIGGLMVVGLCLVGLLTSRGVDDWSRATRNIYIAVLIVLAVVIFFGYDIYFEGFRNGQTPGKRLSGIRVVRDGGGPIDASAAFIRNLVGVADYLPSFYLLGGLVMTLNSRAQRLGDMAAGTIVIRERRDEAPDDVEPLIKEMASEAFTFRPDHLDRCGAGDLHVLYSFFARYYIMEKRERRRLAEKLCDIFVEKTGYAPENPIESRHAVRSFLASLYRDLKARRQYQ
jgi:uncharacterized RDD family membrane protein YckC